MKQLMIRSSKHLLAAAAASLLVLPIFSATAGDKPFPTKVPSLFGSLPEGFAIGRGAIAYDGSVDGSIYRVNLRNGKGEILVEAEDGFNADTDCYKLGMRVDPRTNYLFVAGCQQGNAYVFDADNGTLLAEYQMPLPEGTEGDTYQLVNDLTITKDAVYFTDSHQPLLYRLPLSNNGGLPAAGAATAIVLSGDFVNITPEEGCCGANGIVSTPDGKTLIVGQSNYAQLYRVDPKTGHADTIVVDQPISGFLDGLAFRGGVLYIMTPQDYPEIPEMVQVVTLSKDLLSAQYNGFLTDPLLDGVASGALFGSSLYVNSARYSADPVSEKWITKLNIHKLQNAP